MNLEELHKTRAALMEKQAQHAADRDKAEAGLEKAGGALPDSEAVHLMALISGDAGAHSRLDKLESESHKRERVARAFTLARDRAGAECNSVGAEIAKLSSQIAEIENGQRAAAIGAELDELHAAEVEACAARAKRFETLAARRVELLNLGTAGAAVSNAWNNRVQDDIVRLLNSGRPFSPLPWSR